jgi:hypothetical protein
MTLPVTNYEDLLDQVRELTQETILVQEQLASDLFSTIDSADLNHNLALIQKNYERGILPLFNSLFICAQQLFSVLLLKACDARSAWKEFFQSITDILVPKQFSKYFTYFRGEAIFKV